MFCVVEACLVKWRGCIWWSGGGMFNEVEGYIWCGGGGMQSAEGSTFRRLMK